MSFGIPATCLVVFAIILCFISVGFFFGGGGGGLPCSLFVGV